MPSITALQDQGRALLEDQKTLVNDGRPWSTKRAEYDAREADIKAVIEQVNAQKSVGGNPLLSAALQDGTAAPAGVAARMYGSKALPAMPSLRLSADDAGHLFEAAKSGQALRIDTKAVATSATLGGAPVHYVAGMVSFLREPTRVANLMPTVAADASTIDYYVLAGGTAAAAVSEGGAKPESTVTASLKSLPMSKVAHWAQATSEALADFPSFMQVLESDLVAGLILAESNQILNGSGVAPNMLGILNASGILTQVTVAATDPLIALSTAITTLRTGSSFIADPTAIVMHPADLNKIRTLKASGSGQFIAGNPFEAGPSTVWGIPVTTTTAIAVGTALVADFNALGAVYVREGINLQVDPYSQMTSNITRIVCEERLAVAVVRPTAALKLTGLNS